MIIALSIVVGIVTAWISYRVFFFDASDCLDGLDRLGKEENQWLWKRTAKRQTSEDFADESWSSGIRAFVFLAVSTSSGILTYYGLHKLFYG